MGLAVAKKNDLATSRKKHWQEPVGRPRLAAKGLKWVNEGRKNCPGIKSCRRRGVEVKRRDVSDGQTGISKSLGPYKPKKAAEAR
jgi:hypothetical protein